MATKQRSRSRRPSDLRERGPRHVEPVLDPSWQNPYAPSNAERHHHQRVVRRFAVKRRLPQTILVGVLALVLVALVVVVPWLPALGVVVALVYAYALRRALVGYVQRGQDLGELVRGALIPTGDASQQLRLTTVLDRLAATFGVDAVSSFIVRDGAYNAALLPEGRGFSLLVTSALMQDFELIELEGVVAHCLARQRLGLLERESLASVLSISESAREELAGKGLAYRADEVAAASIRYPLGLASALRKCSRQVLPGDSFFSSERFAAWRWVFFNQWCDRDQGDLGDLDDTELRARALEEW